MLARLMSLFALAFTLAACADSRASSATALPTRSPQPVAQSTAQPVAPALSSRPGGAPEQPPTAVPAAIPTMPLKPTSKPPTSAPIAAATATPARVATPAPKKARHVFPVQSDGKISYGRFHHDYPAADIFCPIGSVFVAVTDGVVDFVSHEDVWDPKVDDGATRGGLAVAIVGDDGVRYYGSHLSQVADGIVPGARVVAGQQLGLTGKSGDARFTDSHLHFGISHPTAPEDWEVRRGEIAPYDYLQAWQRGEDVTPDLSQQ
ncbi:MAG TPA: peptidoglycan DD-metalloendopeptidase family protein [Roseiflexaceae bacterium]|nr:peptidoglycan DD-metalloendopeptidase family protein [Roseiflexaceae bacterium]